MILPIVARAEDSGWCGQDVKWSFNEGVLTISGEGDMSITGSIPWRDYCDSIETIKVESGVTSIEGSAFSGCRNLISVTLPESMTTIGECAFSMCSSLTDLKIPDSVTDIGWGAFLMCESLENIVIPDGVLNIAYSLFEGCQNLGEIILPKNLSTIGNFAFQGCNALKNIELPNGVTSIGRSAFYECYELSGVVIPEGVTKIEDQTFEACKKLESVELPASVTSIGKDAFLECHSLTKINIPEGVTKIEYRTFMGCIELGGIELPATVTSIGEYAFCNCFKLADIEIPNNVTDIGNYAFSACRITNIVIPEGTASIGEYAFAGSGSLRNVTISNSVMSIGSHAFQDCMLLTSIVIPEGVTDIEEGVFFRCNGLTNVTLPISITKIKKGAFENCSNINTVSYYGTEKLRESILIESENDYLTNAEWNYMHQHMEEVDPAVEPTYFDEGLTEGSHCSTCGETITAQQTVPKKTLGVPAVTAVAGTGSVNLTWNQTDGATGYEIFRSDQQAGSYSKIQTVSGGSTLSFNDAGLNADTTYYYKVRAVVTANGNSAYSNDSAIVSAKTEPETQEPETPAPSDPESEQPKPEEPKQDTPSQENPEEDKTVAEKPETVTYTVGVSAGKGGKVSGGATKKAGEEVTVKATPDKGYYFTGWKEGGKKVSSSQTYKFKAEKDRKLTAEFAKLSKPVLTVSSADATSIKVSWKKITGATGYEVYRAASKNGKYTKKAAISSAKTVSYTDKKLTTGKAYYYKIRAVASGTVKTTYSEYSGIKNAKPVPAKVADVKASAGSKSVKLSWKKTAGTTGYEIYRAESKSGKYKKVKTINKASTTGYTDKKLKAKKKYYYRVRAYKTVSGKKVYGDYSAVKNATTKK